MFFALSNFLMNRPLPSKFSFTEATVAVAGNLSEIHDQKAINDIFNAIAFSNPGLAMDFPSIERRRRKRQELPASLAKARLKVSNLEKTLSDLKAVERVDAQLLELHQAQQSVSAVSAVFSAPKPRKRARSRSPSPPSPRSNRARSRSASP